MKKLYLTLLPVLLIGLLTGYLIGLKQSVKTNDLSIKMTESVSCNNDCKPYFYEQIRDDNEKISTDINGNSKKEEIIMTTTDCFIGNGTDSDKSTACPGSGCPATEQYCPDSYKEISVKSDSGEEIDSRRIYVSAAGPGSIKLIKYRDENFIELGSLNYGAHSSETMVFKIVNGNIVPVCRKIPNLRDKRVDNCVFYSDAGGADLEIQDNTLMVLESFKTDSAMNMIDGEYSSGGITSVYKNGQFVTQR